jgi:L-alanine-DL-glutamate epimerase-like enolase superfamily enzyme
MQNEKPGGHGERSVAVGVLDMALWDIAAKAADVPLAELLAIRRGGSASKAIHVYAAGGYYDAGKGVDGLRHELEGYLAMGYEEVKIKVGGASTAEDLERVDAAIEVAGSPARVAVDANGRFALEAARGFGREIEHLGLRWYEEPVDPLDYAAHADLAATYAGALATGENLFSVQDVRNLLRHGGLRPDRDVLQMDPVLSYGLTEYLRMLESSTAAGWALSSCVPHGGHLLNLHAAAGLGLTAIEAYPAVFQPFGGMGDNARLEAGMVNVPDAPGIGLEQDSGIYAVLKELT